MTMQEVGQWLVWQVGRAATGHPMGQPPPNLAAPAANGRSEATDNEDDPSTVEWANIYFDSGRSEGEIAAASLNAPSERGRLDVPLRWALRMQRIDRNAPLLLDEEDDEAELDETASQERQWRREWEAGEVSEIGDEDRVTDPDDPAFELVDTVIAGRWRRRRTEGSSDEIYFDASFPNK